MAKLRAILVTCFVALGAFAHAAAPPNACKMDGFGEDLGRDFCKVTYCSLMRQGRQDATLKDITLPATQDSCAVAVTQALAPSYTMSAEMKEMQDYLATIHVSEAAVTAFPKAAMVAYGIMLQKSLMLDYLGRSLVRHSTSVMEQLQKGIRMIDINIDWDAPARTIVTTTAMVETNTLANVLQDINDFLVASQVGGMKEFVSLKFTNKYVGSPSQMKAFALALTNQIKASFTGVRVYVPKYGLPSLKDLIFAKKPQVIMYMDATEIVKRYSAIFFGPAEMPTYYSYNLQQSTYGLMKDAATMQSGLQDVSPTAVRVIPFTFNAEPFNINYAFLGLLAQPGRITNVGLAVLRVMTLNRHSEDAAVLKEVLGAVAKDSPLPIYVDNQLTLTQKAFTALDLAVYRNQLFTYAGAPTINALPLFTVGFTDKQFLTVAETALHLTLTFTAPKDEI